MKTIKINDKQEFILRKVLEEALNDYETRREIYEDKTYGKMTTRVINNILKKIDGKEWK